MNRKVARTATVLDIFIFSIITKNSNKFLCTLGSSSPHLGMNSPNLVPNPNARLGNSPMNNLNAINNMNAPSMGSPINQNPHVMKNNGQMCPPLNNMNGPLGIGENLREKFIPFLDIYNNVCIVTVQIQYYRY